jgi:cell division protein ZapA
MGQVNVQVGGRSYSVACRDGEEDRLQRLAAHIDRKVDDLTGALGQLSEPRLLLMAGLLIADELFELREGSTPAAAPAGPALDAMAERIERLAEALERRAANP